MAIHASSSSYIALTAADWLGTGLAVGKPTGKTDGPPNINGELVGMLLRLTEGGKGREKQSKKVSYWLKKKW